MKNFTALICFLLFSTASLSHAHESVRSKEYKAAKAHYQHKHSEHKHKSEAKKYSKHHKHDHYQHKSHKKSNKRAYSHKSKQRPLSHREIRELQRLKKKVAHLERKAKKNAVRENRRYH